MNTETGETGTLENLVDNETADLLSQNKITVEEAMARHPAIQRLERKPSKHCPRCAGQGVRPRTFGKHAHKAKGFKPCRCTRR